MEIQFLGTGAGVPAKHRNVSSIALKLLDECNSVWLFDCGEATQQQILHTNIRPRKIDKIFITHLHGDHIFGLPGFVSSRSFQNGEEPLTIYGPKGIRDFVLTSLKVTETRLKYPLHFHEITTGGIVFQNQQFTVNCLPLDHRIACFGYRITETDHQGELQVAKLQALEVPSGPLYGKLKRRETVTLSDGRVLDGRDFVGEDKKGRVVTILGDTRQTENIFPLAQDADVLVHESTFQKNEERMAREYFHSTNVQAAQVAKKAGVKKLLLTHISARYLAKETRELEKEAQKIFPNTQVVKDFDLFEIPLSSQEEELSDEIRA